MTALLAYNPAVRFDWDPTKNEANRAARGFGFDLAALIFEGHIFDWLDDRRDYGETRFRAVGMADDMMLHVVFTDRGDVRRIISARMANKKERDLWQVSR